MSTITLHSLADYNNGKLISNTFDLDDYSDHDEYQTAVSEWLEELTNTLGELREESIVCDYDDIPKRYVGEDALDSEYWDYKDAIEASYHDSEVFEAAIDCDIPLSDIDEAYAGEHKSDEDFAQELLEDIGTIPRDLPAYVYIDWERTARDIMMDYCDSNGHYFRNL